jgi:PRC-barrel domain
MKQFVRLGTALACGLVVVGAVLAQQRTDTRTVTSTTTIHRGTVVMGANVVLQDGTTVGRVEDFVITDGGCIDYVVVAYESKYVLVPWTVATWSGDRTIRMNVARDRFVQVPTFTRDQWTTVQDTQYIQRVRTAWGVSDSRYGDSNRQPLDRRDDRDQRRDDKTKPPDRRDDRRDARDQRKDVENPNRPPTTNPPDRRDTSKDKDKDRDRPKPPDRPPPPPPPQ